MNINLLKNKEMIATIFVILFLNGCATSYPAEPDLDANDNSKAYSIIGSGTPAIVLQAGLQDGKEAWAGLLPQLAKQSQLVAFDRPGHGGNPATDASRDPCTIANEQRQMLQAAGIQPPYILVGHSLGGLYQYVYAKLYPNEVAGIVLLDPTHPTHWETLQREFPVGSTMIKTMRLTVFTSTDKKEFDAQTQCLNSLDMSQPLNIPSKLLVSGRFRSSERSAYENMLKPLRQDWLRLLGSKQLQTVWDSGHYIQKDSPEEVVSAVQTLLLEIQ